MKTITIPDDTNLDAVTPSIWKLALPEGADNRAARNVARDLRRQLIDAGAPENCVVIVLHAGTSLEGMSEDHMRAAGWARAPQEV